MLRNGASSAALFAAFAVGCAGGERPVQPGQEQRAAVEGATLRPAIIGGGPSSEARNGAVFLGFEGPKGSGAFVFQCTAALIAANLIVTARHCVSEVEVAEVACDEKGTQVSGGEVGQDRPASRFVVHVGTSKPVFGAPAGRGAKIVHDGAKVLCGHDIAFVVLEKAIQAAPIMPIRLGSAPRVGESLLAIGYGITQTEAEPPVRQERAVLVRQVGPFEGDVDEPPVAPRDFLVGESFCQGDSGGPAVSEATGAIVGIATRVTNGNASPSQPWDPCVGPRPVYAFYTQTGAFGELARSAFAAAGAKPWVEGGRDPRLPPEDEGCSVGSRARSDAGSSGALSLAALALGLAFTRRARARGGRS